MQRLVLALFLVSVAPRLAVAQPTAAEIQSRALFQEGNRHLAAKDFARALTLYDEALARHPRPSILINRAAALVGLGRLAEAADAYAAVLAAPGTSAAQVPDVRRELAGLDARLARLEIGVSEPGAVVILDGAEVGPSPQNVVRRVAPGRHEIAARKEGFTPAQVLLTVNAGERRALTLDLVRATVAPPPVPVEIPEPVVDPPPVVRVTRPPRIAMLLRGDVDGASWRGGAVVVGMGVALGRVDLAAGAILGPTPGAEASLTFAFTRDRLSPIAGLGVPLYFAGDGMILSLIHI